MRAQTLFKFSWVLALVTLLLGSAISFANPILPVPTRATHPNFTPSAPNLEASGYILIDYNSGRVIAEKNADNRMPPASLTKLMSLYVISGAIQSGQIKLDDKVRISSKAWKTEGSRMFVKVGDEVPVRDLLQGIVVDSGNDATVALAEYVAGSEDAFASLMNQQAKLLGMVHSNFVDSTGLPNPNHYSTAHDLAILTLNYIKNFPEDYSFYSQKWFTYNGIKQPNRNRLLWRYQYADGLKTGHTKEAGFCLVGSAKKDDMRLVSVVLGAPSDNARTEDSIRLLTYGFRFFETHKIYEKDQALTNVRVWQGAHTNSSFGLASDLFVTIPTGQYKHLQFSMKLDKPLKAPLLQGQTYGQLNISLNNQVIATKPLVALQNNMRGGILRRAADAIKLNIHSYFSKSDDNVNTT